jgi:iron complex outermembrane receptor protein
MGGKMNQNARWLARLLAGTCLLSPGVAQVALAQTANPGAPQAPAATQGAAPTQLEEVVVKAQRRSERLQKVPITVTAISGEQLASHGETSTNSLTDSVSNLSMNQIGTAVTPYIRGVGSNGSNPNDEQSVALYVDGVYIASPIGNIFDFNNIDQVEVLKGPQGTLFGRNATGGVIQILTKDPSSTPSGQVSIGYGNYDTIKSSLYATGGIGPNLAGDVAFVYGNNLDGYGHDIYNGTQTFRQENVGLRSSVLWTPSDETSVRISGDYSTLDGTGTDYQLLPGIIGADGMLGYPGKFNTDANWPNFANIQAYGGSVRVRQSFDFADLISLSAYRYTRELYSLDEDSSPAPIVNSRLTGLAQDFSQELQLVSKADSELKWLLGGYYFNARYAYAPFYLGGAAAAGFGLPSVDIFGTQRTSSGSVYGQATYPITTDLHLTAGLRYTAEYQSDRGSVEGGGITLLTAPFENHVADRLTWRFALDYQFNDNLLGYISDNRGMKSGGFNLLNPGTPGYAPEILDAYEIGMKSSWLDRRLVFNLSGFYYDYHHIQVQTIETGGVYTVNAAAAALKGFDLDTTMVILPGLTASGGLGYTDGEYTDFPNATFTPPSPYDGPQTLGNASGKRVVNAPRWSANGSLDYTFNTPHGDFQADVTATYRGMTYVTADNRLSIPSYTLVNMALTWMPTPLYSLQLWAHNVGNETYYASRVETSLGDIQYQGPPRTYGFTLTRKF